LNKYRDVQKLVSMLLARGFSEQQVQSVFYGNWLRFFDEALP
jgi:microsomal dipeptidase-like Zn-dependent dipeptidase